MTKHKAIVTGSSKGIGKAISNAMIQQGIDVIGVSRSNQENCYSNEAFTPYLLDLSDIESLPTALKELADKHADVQTLVCNAGQGLFGNLEELSFQQIENLMNINFLSHVYLIKTFLPMLKKQRKGNIILIGSEAALEGRRQGTVYCASKFALRGFSQALREECSSKGIRVTLINPGMVQTDFFKDLHFSPGSEQHESIQPEDVADIVSLILKTRTGTVLDEINLSPQSKKVVFNHRCRDN